MAEKNIQAAIERWREYTSAHAVSNNCQVSLDGAASCQNVYMDAIEATEKTTPPVEK